MQRILSILVGLLIAAVLAAVVVVNGRPDTTHVERSVVMNATPADVFALGNDLKRTLEWSPWMGLDPDQEVAFSESTAGVGAWYTWEGDENVGKGRQEVIESVENERVVTSLEFIEPWEANATATLTFVPEGDGTRVTWALDTENSFVAKAMGLVMDMDESLGSDFQKGLDQLKPLAEAAAVARAEAEAAAEEAETQAASDQDAVEATD